MREILFKAKRLDNGEWVEGSLISTEDNSGFILRSKTKAFIPKGTNTFCSTECYEIDQTTLCRYTGLVDKNGQKIWENDILKCKKYIGGNFVDYCIEVGYVEMKHGAFGLHRIKNDAYYRPFKDWLEDYEYEVVGNIFDDKELLEVE